MEKRLTAVGNSMAVTLPSAWIKQHNVERITMQITEEGILIKPVSKSSSLELKMQKARESKAERFKQMEKEANDPETIAYYENRNNTFEDVDLDIL